MFTKVFLNYMLNVVDKGIFPYMSKHARIYHERWRILLSGMLNATYICGLTGFVVPETLVLYS